MKKYICFLFCIFLFQSAFAKTDCDKHINDYHNGNYRYDGGPSAVSMLAIQRRCLHARNQIYSDAHEFEQKQKYFLNIDDSFSVRKNLIDYQEEAEIASKNGNIQKSSEYIDKFNDILIKHYDKILAAKILTEQVERGVISKAHKEELFEKLDKYLFRIGKCNPDICEGWGLISTVAGAFPKCKEDSCQKNITYENLYFALAKTTDNLPKATDTIQKLLAKDFGSSKSNGEVKASLIMALYYADYDAFSRQAKNFLDEAQKTIRYDYQDAIILPLITQFMLANGEAMNLLPYTKTKHKNIAGLEATLALLSIRLGDIIRQNLRADLEIYYELTSACEGGHYEEYQGQKILKAGTRAMITQNTELDLFLRQRIQIAYWVDEFGDLMQNKATNYWCAPSLKPEEIDPIFASAQTAKRFMREGFIDDVLLLPLFAFNKIKTVVNGIRQAPTTLRVSYYNDKALEVAQNTRRMQMQIDRELRQLDEMLDYRIAVNQDFMHDYIGDRGVNIITDGRTSAPKHYGTERYYELKREVKETSLSKLEGPREFHNNNYPKDFDNLPKKAQRRIEKEIKYFEENAEPWMKNIGYENTKKLAKIMGVKWGDLKDIIKNPQLKAILQTSNPTIARSILERAKNLYNKYRVRIMNNPKSRFNLAYFTPDGIYNGYFNSNNIFLIEEVNTKYVNIEDLLQLPKQGTKKVGYLSKKKKFSPREPKQTLEAYVDLLRCTEKSPCTAEFTDKGRYLRIISADNKRFIRVAPHEYYLSEETYAYLSKRLYSQVKEFPRYHFHYYEIYGDRALNYHINVDLSNGILSKSPAEIKELLIPTQEILNSPLIRMNFR